MCEQGYKHCAKAKVQRCSIWEGPGPGDNAKSLRWNVSNVAMVRRNELGG